MEDQAGRLSSDIDIHICIGLIIICIHWYLYKCILGKFLQMNKNFDSCEAWHLRKCPCLFLWYFVPEVLGKIANSEALFHFSSNNIWVFWSLRPTLNWCEDTYTWWYCSNDHHDKLVFCFLPFVSELFVSELFDYCNCVCFPKSMSLCK